MVCPLTSNSMKKPPRYALLLALALILKAGAQTASQPVLPQGKEEPQSTIELSPFQVNTERDRGYSASQAMGASRVALPVSDVPLAVVGINEQFFADRAAVDALDVLPFVSGVQRGGDLNPGQEQFTLRGYALIGMDIRDGLPDNVAAADQPYDDGSAYERLEVIKGPAGTLYGTTGMGGVVNKISKWPRFSRQTKIQLQAQSYDEFVRGMVDTTGPMGDRNAYRAVLSKRTGNRFWDHGRSNDFFNSVVAFTRLLGDSRSGGRVWTRFQFLDIEVDRENGTQFPTGYLNPLSPTTPVVLENPNYAVKPEANNQPNDDISKAAIRAYEAGFEHSFDGPIDSKWTLRLVGRHNTSAGDKSPSYAQTLPVPVDSTGAIVRYTNAAGALVNGDSRFISATDPRVADWRTVHTLRQFSGYNKSSGGYMDLVGDFTTGPMKHKIVVNAQLTSSARERAFFFWAVTNPGNTTAVANSYSAINPDFSSYNAATITAGNPSFNSFSGHAESNGFAGGFQDNISMFNDRLIAVAGARYDNIHTTTYGFDSAASIAARRFVANPASTRTVTNQQWTSKYGLVGKVVPGVSLYGQVGETYIPINTINATTGLKLPNQEGNIREAGIKLDFLGSKLVATAAVFKMELTNVLVSVVNPPELGGGTVQVPVGKQTSDGHEIDLAWEPVPGWNLSAAYSKVDSKDERGFLFRGVPRQATYSLLTKYSFLNGDLKGAYVGGSWKHNGEVAGDATNLFFVPANDTFDAFLGYGRGRWNVQLNVFNVGDTDKMVTAVTNIITSRARARSFRFTFNYTF